jgi:hypothetical protein
LYMILARSHQQQLNGNSKQNFFNVSFGKEVQYCNFILNSKK